MMHKIATTTELQQELYRLLAYAQSERPSRSRLARELEVLSNRIAGKRVAATPHHMSLEKAADEWRKATSYFIGECRWFGEQSRDNGVALQAATREAFKIVGRPLWLPLMQQTITDGWRWANNELEAGRTI